MALEPINLTLNVDLDAKDALEMGLEEPPALGMTLGGANESSLTLSPPPSYEIELQEPTTLDLTLGDISMSGNLPTYHGTTHVTPSSEQQTLSTANTSVYEDIVIDAIPSNYGLITWDGYTLVVS